MATRPDCRRRLPLPDARRSATERAGGLCGGHPMTRDGSFPLSPLQQGIYLDVLAERSDALHVTQSGWELSGPLDADALTSAWEIVVQRHPGLRTGIDSTIPEDPGQFVAPETKLLIERRETSGEAIVELFERERIGELDLQEPPAFRLSLVSTAPDRHVLIWTYSHLLIDGRSVGLVFEEVISAYEALRAGRAVELGEPGRFEDYVAWRSTLDVTEAELFWAEALAGRSGPTPLPTDAMLRRFASPEVDAGPQPFFSCVRTLEPSLVAALHRLARENGV